MNPSTIAPPTSNTNWYQPPQSTGILSEIGHQLPNLASLAAVALAPEASLPALAVRGALGGAAGSLAGSAMGGKTPGVVQSAMGGAELGGQLGFLGGAGMSNDLKPILGMIGNNPQKIANSGLAEAEQTMQDLGIKATPENMHKYSGDATAYYNGVLGNVLQNTPDINMGDLKMQMMPGKVPVSPAQQTLQQVFSNNINNIRSIAGAGTPTQEIMSAPDARNMLTQLQGQAVSAKPTRSPITGSVDPAAQSHYNELQGYVNQLKGAIYERPEVEAQFNLQRQNPLTPKDFISSGWTDNEAVAQRLADTVNKAGTGSKPAYQDVLSDYSKFVRMNQLGKMGLDYANKVAPYKQGGVGPGSAGGILGLLALNRMSP